MENETDPLSESNNILEEKASRLVSSSFQEENPSGLESSGGTTSLSGGAGAISNPPPPPPPAPPNPMDHIYHLRLILFLSILGLFILSGAIWGIKRIVGYKKPEPLIAKFEGVKRLEVIRFVKQTYLEIIPITNDKGKLEFLMEAPHIFMALWI